MKNCDMCGSEIKNGECSSIEAFEDSTTYFMTKMTQEEFEERTHGHTKAEYEFNKVRNNER